MYKCLECGHLFEDGEQALWHEAHGEKFGGCPICQCEYMKAFCCNGCGEWHAENELYDGWCESCLTERINYDSFLEYCEYHSDERYLDIFVMAELLGGMECPAYVSSEFHEMMVAEYKRRVADAYALNDHFICACIRFIMVDDGYIGRLAFAEWLNERGGSRNECGG